MKQPPRVLAAALTWNEKTRTEQCLNALLNLDYPALEAAVVDNGSHDGTSDWLRKNYPQISIVRHRENFGYGEGINGQLRCAIEKGVDYLLSVENDAVVEPGALRILVEAAEKDNKTALVFPGVPPFRGGFFLVRMAAVKKAGYLNPRYFMYEDEREWFSRIKQAGYTETFVPHTLGSHEGGAALGRESRAFYYYKTRNRLHFESKRFGRPLSLLRAFFSLFMDVVPKALLFKRPEEWKGKSEGLFDFARGKWGPRDFNRVPPPFWQRVAGRFKQKRSSVRPPQRIQVNLDWNIGDEIMASPVFEKLKIKYPQARIDVLSRHPALFENHAFVDSTNQGTAFKPDLCIDLHQEIRNRKRSDYLAEIAGVRGWSEPKIYLRPEEISFVKKRWMTETDNFKIALCPEVWWLARRWPRERWIELASRLEKEKNARVFIVGREEDRFPVGLNLVAKTSLRETAALVSLCDLFIGHDSGPLYTALAVGTPSVGLYGPLDPHLLYPPVPYFKPVWTEVECRGCWPDNRMLYRDHCPKIFPDCMTSISVETVWIAVSEMLSALPLRKGSDSNVI